jgi:hypothetical protein
MEEAVLLLDDAGHPTSIRVDDKGHREQLREWRRKERLEEERWRRERLIERIETAFSACYVIAGFIFFVFALISMSDVCGDWNSIGEDLESDLVRALAQIGLATVLIGGGFPAPVTLHDPIYFDEAPKISGDAVISIVAA